MAQLNSAEQARGELLDRWLAAPASISAWRSPISARTARSNCSQRPCAANTARRRGRGLGGIADRDDDKPGFGFAIRNVGSGCRRRRVARELPRSVEQLTELIGRVPLRDLVRETTDVIEKLCIEAALELTGDNRASAAEMLGLSRQSLYVKLRRYGLADDIGDDEEVEA